MYLNNLASYKRIDYIDTARGLSLLAVIVGHIIPIQAPSFQFIGAFLYSFHLPLFFIISGFLFNPVYTPKEFIAKKIKGYIIPYVFCAAVISVCLILFRIVDSGTKNLWSYITWNVIYYFIVQMRFTALWFLTALFCAEIFLYFLFLACRQRIALVWYVAVIFGMVFIIYNMKGMHYLPWNIDISFVVIPFLLFGYSLKQCDFFNRQEVRKPFVPCLLMLVGVVCVACNLFVTGGKCLDMFTGQYHCLPLVFIAAISLSIASILLSEKIKSRGLRWLGANTMTFFAFHQAIAMNLASRIMSLFWIVNPSDVHPALQFASAVLMLLVVVIVCYVIHVIIVKTGFGFLIGKRNVR